ncbi:dynein axonemal assembly factor 4-like [Leguminivora glycinivorella]|uniref:dynein axonemal assembly factor 4-like n=1 Tax=Leguminivora glycinivorella TaxID=1035111 RepID=UPI00200D5660|nr:dynein axonemal assembly factor 4-like [Leguminivora glycinivorella]XP_047992972.1 dynein axonemal assembly factor 4-like [Leguminivora glycinivorella]
MPIIVKEFTWKQTAAALNITIPLSQGKKEKVDLFATDTYIKAHYSPFLFEVFLLHDVNIDKSKCLVKEDLIVLDLVKREEREWEQLEKELTKADKMKLRQEILEKCQEKAKEEFEQKRIKKSEMDRFTVQKAMEIDSRHHELMDKRRDEQRKKAMDALEEWRVNTDGNKGVKIVELPDDKENGVVIEEITDEKPVPKIERDEVAIKKPLQPATPRPKKPVKTPVKSEFVDKKRAEAAKRVLPALRNQGSLEIRHTPRVFPTPSRESARAEEDAWLKNITLARRATGFVSEDLRPEEQDPEWCKNKGDEFFRAGNYLGAISAYTHGVLLSDKLPSLFANRAAAHFALGNFNKCVNDCSTALELLVPACETNRRARAACVARRAAGLARLGYLGKAVDEMKAAARLVPDDRTLRQDIYDMERAWEQNPDDN